MAGRIKNSDSFNCLLNRLDDINKGLRAEFIHECMKAGNLGKARVSARSPYFIMNYHQVSFEWDRSQSGQDYWAPICDKVAQG